MKFQQFFGLAIVVLASCLSGLDAMTLQQLPLANPFSITPNQLASSRLNVRSNVLDLLTNSMVSTQTSPSFASLLNANAPLIAASPLNIAPGLGYLTALSPLRSKVVQVRKPALINPYPTAPFPYITAADVAMAQLMAPNATIPEIQKARIDSKKKPANAVNPSTTPAQQQQTVGASPSKSKSKFKPPGPNLQVQGQEQQAQIADIIQNALQLVQNRPDFLSKLLSQSPPALSSNSFAGNLNDQLMNGLQISLYQGPHSQNYMDNTVNHQTLLLQPDDHNYQQFFPSSGQFGPVSMGSFNQQQFLPPGAQMAPMNMDNGLSLQQLASMLSPNFQSLSTNGH